MKSETWTAERFFFFFMWLPVVEVLCWRCFRCEKSLGVRRTLEKSFLVFIYHTFRKWTTLYKCPPFSNETGLLHEPNRPQTKQTTSADKVATRRRCWTHRRRRRCRLLLRISRRLFLFFFLNYRTGVDFRFVVRWTASAAQWLDF